MRCTKNGVSRIFYGGGVLAKAFAPDFHVADKDAPDGAFAADVGYTRTV